MLTAGWDRSVRFTGKRAKDLKRVINRQRIYPPLDDAAAILASAELDRTWAQMAS